MIRAARLAARVSQDELAERVGLSRTSITNIEQGRQHVPLHTLLLLASALGVEPASLLPNATEPSEDAFLSPKLLRELSEEDQRSVRQVVRRAGPKTLK